jgi:predicted XRE-type DNA-binding protein
MITYMLSPAEIAEQVGVTRQSVSRVARQIGVGVIAGGRLVAVSKQDAIKLKKSLHLRPGKPSQK